MKKVVFRYRRWLILAFQFALVTISLVTAYLLRFDYSIPKREVELLQKGLLVALAAKGVAFRTGGLDKGWSRFMGISDLYLTLRANIMGSVLFAVGAYFVTGGAFSRSVYGIDFLVCLLLTAMARCAPRIYSEMFAKEFSRKVRKRLIIYGAGLAGATLLREVRMNPSLGYRAIGFIDDDENKRNIRVLGLPVLGTGRDAVRICATWQRKRSRIDEIVIAMPSATGHQMTEALANCRAAGVPCKTVPSVGELLSGKVLSSQIREVSVLDLLGREPVSLDESEIRNTIQGRTVMITGAAGSIGSELCRQVARFGPKRLVAFEQAESELFRIDNELKQKFPALAVIPQIGDIRDYERVQEVIREHRVDSIFHAAAYKHVPMMEHHVLEAVKNNILGTRNVVYAAARNGVTSFLMISSDKAVNPTNIMGATKRVAELIISAFPLKASGGHTKCVSVRFGNVLGSNGSVIPVFREQIASGGPVTVTHPEMRRYFMTIPEAVQLVLQASTMGKGSEIFVLDMGEPVKIIDLARNMIRLSGREPDRDVEIRFTGLRPGEKLFEEIATKGENILSTYHEKIKIFAGHRLVKKNVEAWIGDLEALMEVRDERGVIEHIRELVPEYQLSEEKSKLSAIRPKASSVVA